MEWISFVISIFALGGSLFTYLYHDRKLKKQERLIQDYEISKIEEEKEDTKKASVKANCIKIGSGKRTIKIFNAGKAIATNIRLEFNPSDISNSVRTNNFPFPYLNPQESTELFIVAHSGIPDTFEIKMIWDDKFKNDNQYSQILTL